jgi:hypothetical protein
MPVTIGDRGRAVTPLRPTGFVDVNGSRLEAKLAPARTIAVEVGAEVVIVGADAFGLLVRAAVDLADVSALPGYGEPVPTPAEQGELREEIEKQNWEEEQEETKRDLQKETLVFAIPLGLAFLAGYLFFGLQAAVALALAWVAIFFGLGLALAFLGSSE